MDPLTCGVLRNDLSTTCIGFYYLENFDALQEKCKFDPIEAQEHVFQLARNNWIISLSVEFPTTIKCPNTFTSITVRSSSQITVPPGCQVYLRWHSIQPDSTTTNSDLETIHTEWSWDSNFLFPTYHTQEFEQTIRHSNNEAAMTKDNISSAVTAAFINSESVNKTMEDYFKDLENIRLSDSKPATFVDNVIIFVLTFITIQSCYCMFQICFIPSHNVEPLFPTYKPREWTKRRSRKNKHIGTVQEMAPIRHKQ